jgi:predicted deacylase
LLFVLFFAALWWLHDLHEWLARYVGRTVVSVSRHIVEFVGREGNKTVTLTGSWHGHELTGSRCGRRT